MTRRASTTKEQVKPPLETSTVLAFTVAGLLLIALFIGVAIKDTELVRDLAKNFIGPGFLLILGFYFGSSSSSKRKDETNAKIADAMIESQREQ